MASKTQPGNPRDGSVKKPDKDKPAELKKGRAKPPKGFDAAEFCEKLNLWWENDGGDTFIVQSTETLWSRWPMSSIVKLAKEELGYSIGTEPLDGERISQMDQVLLHARRHRCVEKMLPALAGYKAGRWELSDGRRVIVRMSPRLIEPVQGEWPTVKTLIEDRLDLGEGDMDQTVYFHAWSKVAYESLLFGEPGSFKPGHGLVLAGPVGSGKSRLQINIITPLLGGRKADPTAFLTGDDSFNSDLVESEHLMMEELLMSSWSSEKRTALSEAMKRMIVNESKRLRLMRTDPLTVDLYSRFTLTINNDPDKLRNFPMLTPDFRDKILMLLVQKRPMPMPTGSAQEQKAFNDKIKSELPGYAWWLLNEFVIPEKMFLDEEGQETKRFGFASFQHPSLAAQLFDDTPAAQLLKLIDAAEFGHKINGDGKKLWDLSHPYNSSGGKPRGLPWVCQPNVWRGGAEDLEDLLCGHVEGWSCNVARAASRLLNKAGASTMLSRLKEDRAERVAKSDRADSRGWLIQAPMQPDQPTPEADKSA